MSRFGYSVSFCFFLCTLLYKCVLYYYHRLSTQLQLTNVSHIISYHIISYHIISYHIISYHIISYRIVSYRIVSYHIISYHIITYHVVYHIIYTSQVAWWTIFSTLMPNICGLSGCNLLHVIPGILR